MKATALDFRRRMGEIIKALDRNEPVTLSYRGQTKGILYPVGQDTKPRRSLADHPAVGMWKDREDMKDVEAWVRRIRKGRMPRILADIEKRARR